MTTKIPVGAVIARTYGFAVGNFINNLGETWIPQAALLAADYFLLPRYLGVMRQFVPAAVSTNPAQNAAAAQAAAMHNLQLFASAAPAFSLLYLIAIICTCAMFVGITKEALGVRTGSPFLQNPIGAPTWRFLGALVLYALLIFAIYIAVFIVGVVGAMSAVAVGSAGTKAIAALVLGLVAIVLVLGFIYVGARAGFLIAPAVVAEKRVTLATGWRLARGNFWRIVAVSLAVFLPVVVVELVAFSFLLGTQLPPMHAGTSPQDIQAWSQQLNGQMLDLMGNMFQRWWYVTFPIMVVITTVLYGLLAGVSAFSYRALSEEKDTAAEFA
jgi:hypothetical protein